MTTTVTEEIPATLMLVPEYGSPRPATDTDLERMGYRHERTIYLRYAQMRDRMGVDPDNDRLSLIRYFFEYAYMYNHDIDDADLARMKHLLETGEYVADCEDDPKAHDALRSIIRAGQP